MINEEMLSSYILLNGYVHEEEKELDTTDSKVVLERVLKISKLVDLFVVFDKLVKVYTNDETEKDELFVLIAKGTFIDEALRLAEEFDKVCGEQAKLINILQTLSIDK